MIRAALRRRAPPRISFFSFQDIITSVTGILILVTLILMLQLQPESAAGADPTQARLRQTLDALSRLAAQNQALQTLLLAAESAPDTPRLEADVRNLRQRLDDAQVRLEEIDARHRDQTETERALEFALGVPERRAHLATLQARLETLRTTNDLLQAELQRTEARQRELAARLERTRNEATRLWLIPEADTSGKQPVLAVVSGRELICQRFDAPAPLGRFPAADADAGFARLIGTLRPESEYVVFYVRPSGIPLFRRCRDLARAAGFEVGHDAVEENQEVVFRNTDAP